MICLVAIVLVVAILAVIGVSFLQKQVREQFATSSGEVLAHEVTTGSISTVVSGSGSLTDVDLNSITVPEGVEITEVKVKTNQAIAKGDILATVDMASVISAMADLQVQIEDLDEQLSDAEDDAASTTIYAGVAGFYELNRQQLAALEQVHLAFAGNLYILYQRPVLTALGI